MRFLSIVVLAFWGLVAIAQQPDVKDKIMAAMADDIRTEAEIERDRNRRPVETLEFFGLKDDMRVLELLPGGGWYTRVLAPVLAENGKLYVALGTNTVKERILNQPGFEQVELLENSANVHRDEERRIYVIDEFEFGVSDLDMVVTFRNLHNFDPESRARMNSQVIKSLKSGGLYGVVDHTRRHMESSNNENRRRIDPVLIIMELLDQGFEFVDYSDIHFRADDELVYEVGRRSVSGNTDRFTMLFRKP